MSLQCLSSHNRACHRDSHVGSHRFLRAGQHEQRLQRAVVAQGLLKGLFGNGSSNGSSSAAPGEAAVECSCCHACVWELLNETQISTRGSIRNTYAHISCMPLTLVSETNGCLRQCRVSAAELIDTETADFGPDPDSIVLSEMEGDQGKCKVIYRPGGEVDVAQLGDLCEKVGWPKRPSDKVAGALKNSFLVCTRLQRQQTCQLVTHSAPFLKGFLQSAV